MLLLQVFASDAPTVDRARYDVRGHRLHIHAGRVVQVAGPCQEDFLILREKE